MADDTEEYPEGHDVVVQKNVDCPECGRDNAVLYADGHIHCFSQGCEYHTGPSSEGGQPHLRVVGGKPKAGGYGLLPADTGSFVNGKSTRRLKEETLRKFGVFYHPYGDDRALAQVYPYYNQQGAYCAQKLRMPGKEFPVLKGDEYPGGLSKCKLFGWHVWGDRYDRQIIITEGELDALSVAQATSFKTAVVSINAGADKAADCLKANYLWVDRFEDIVLWLDDDEPGRKAAEECASLFKVGKVRIARPGQGIKDASDLLQKDKPGDIQTAIYQAAAWKPRGIVNAKDNIEDVLAPEEDVLVFPYPPQMERLNEMMGGGMALGDVTYHVAGTGVGKSTGLREIQYHLKEQGVKFAVLSFEDTVRDMKLGLMSIAASERLGLIPVPRKEDTKARTLYNNRMGELHHMVFDGGLVELFDPVTAEWTMKAILGYVRYCAKALGCQVVFIDPISFVAAGIDLNADERRALDAVAAEFAKMAKELNIHIAISHHLKRKDQGVPHEEGAPTSLNELRSSGGLANFAMAVIGWERNNQAPDDSWRVVQLRVIKPLRRVGLAGLADVLYFQENGRLVKSPIPFPPIGKPDGGDGNDRGNRGPRIPKEWGRDTTEY